jgi:hypothetical protein
MVWPSSAQGNRPYAPQTRQTVCIVVTLSPENSFFCPLCFQSLTHSFASSFFATPLQSICSTLFAQNTRGGYTLQTRLIFSRTYALFKTWRFYPAGVFLSLHGSKGTGHRPHTPAFFVPPNLQQEIPCIPFQFRALPCNFVHRRSLWNVQF